MNGELICVDTNIIIYTLAGRQDLADRVKGRTVMLSVISEIEALSFPELNDTDRERIAEYVRRCTVVGISDRVKHEAIRIRSKAKMKLPDAIIAATALALDATLLTADEGFSHLSDMLKLDLVQPGI